MFPSPHVLFDYLYNFLGRIILLLVWTCACSIYTTWHVRLHQWQLVTIEIMQESRQFYKDIFLPQAHQCICNKIAYMTFRTVAVVAGLAFNMITMYKCTLMYPTFFLACHIYLSGPHQFGSSRQHLTRFISSNYLFNCALLHAPLGNQVQTAMKSLQVPHPSALQYLATSQYLYANICM